MAVFTPLVDSATPTYSIEVGVFYTLFLIKFFPQEETRRCKKVLMMMIETMIPIQVSI